jgi:NAD(P)-dependent dehydrogenase (short-subunit alcohol dehydrogenase family)
MTSLNQQVLLVTGATGIAGATLKLAVASGARVYYTGLEEDACRQLAAELNAPQAVGYRALDITDPENAETLVSACVERFGRLDALFNVAGTSGRKYGDGPLESCTEEGWTRTMQANLDTQYRMSREAIRQMQRQTPQSDGTRGVILNMSSILGLSPEPGHFSALAYATAKGAIVTMTRQLAAFYAGAGIRVNAIAPGLAATRMSARAMASPEILSFVEKKQPLTAGVIPVEDIAGIAVFLLSSQSRVITAQTIVCDAGWSVS